MKFSSTIFSLCIGAAVQSCVSLSSVTQTQYTSVQPSDCESRPNRVELFFEGEPINFSYSKLGIIEVRGSVFTDNNHYLDRLKYKAWNQCANGVIAITSQEIDRGESEDERVFKGIAVVIERDTFLASSEELHETDTSFVQRVEQQDKGSQTIDAASSVVIDHLPHSWWLGGFDLVSVVICKGNYVVFECLRLTGHFASGGKKRA